MARRIVLYFSDDRAGPLRLRLGDVLLIARRDEDGVLKIIQEREYLYTNDQGMPVITTASYDSLDEYIEEALKEGALSVEILAHSAYQSAHFLSSSVTSNCTAISFPIDELTAWLESDILKKNITKVSISLIICQAGSETAEFPSIAAQMFALFTEKPLRITARKGFVYVSNREKLYSLGTFDMLLHKAFLSKETSPDTYLERISFPVLRGLRTVLNHTQLHTYNSSTPLNEKFVYFQNNQNETLKIDKYLYDLYKLSHPKPEKKLEQCTKEDFISLANLGKQSDKTQKLYKKSEIILNDTDLIYPATILQIDVKNYQKREQLFRQIDQLHESIEITPLLRHAKKFSVLLNIIEVYINSRYFLNLPLGSTERLLNVLNRLIAQNGQFNEHDFQEIEAIAEHIQSMESIESDVAQYARLAGLQWPTNLIYAMNHSTQMNEQFANRLETFSKMIRIENQFIENEKTYTIKSDREVNSNRMVAPGSLQEETQSPIYPDIEKLRQLIHHQMQEASYLFSFSKFTSTQLEILTFLLQLIHATQKQEINPQEADSFAPLLVQAIRKLTSTDPQHPRINLIEHGIDDFVKKHYTISDSPQENTSSQNSEIEPYGSS